MVLAESDQSLGIVLPEPAHGPGMVLPESDQERGSAPVSASTPAPLRRALRVGFYDIEGTLGKGNFAVVKLARHRVTRSRVAIKIIDKRRLQPRELQRVHREVLIMKFLNHPHIIKLYQVMETRDMLYIVTEFAQNGEMFEHLSERGPLSEREAREKFGQLLSAVEYCHRHHIVHRDLKTENMLLDADMNIKLADFGFGNFYRHGEMLSTWCGSPPYAAPEVFEGRDYEGPHLDVWSLGVVLYVLVCGSLPFDGPTLPILRQRVIEGHFRVPFFLSKDCEDLIRRMLTVDPLKRITIPEIKRHCWLTGQAIPHHPPAPPIHGETVNVCSYNYQVLSLMQTLGIDWHKTIESLQNNSYNHFAAIYYLLLERIKEHRQTQAGNRLPSALCPHPQARGGHSQTTALSAAAEHSAMCRDRSMSPRMDCTELRDLSVSPGMECSELRDQSVSPGVECTELRDQSVSPGVECTELRDQSVSPGVECTELRDRSVSPGMECSEFRDQSVSPGMECTELRDLSVSPGMECSEFRDQSMSLGMERSELRDPSASPTGVGVSIAQERGLQLKDNSTGSVMRARSTGCRRHTVAEGLFTPGQQSTPAGLPLSLQHLPAGQEIIRHQPEHRAKVSTFSVPTLPGESRPQTVAERGAPPATLPSSLPRLAPWDRPAHLLPEWRLSQTMGSHEGPLQSHHVHWQHRELQLAFLGEQEAPPLAPPCAVGAPVLQNAVGSVLQPAAVSLPQAVPSPLSCSLVAFHVPSLLSELLQRQQRLQADCEMEDLAAPCLSKVVLVN